MKMISEHLGRIIATLAAIAVVIGVITCYRADLGEFFMNVISGEQRIADGVLGNMGDFDLNGDYQGPDLTTDQALGSSSDNPLGVGSSSFTLSGTVTDESGVASLTVNGTNVTVADDGTWRTTLTLTQNVATEVRVVATDSEGNTTEKTGYVGYIVYNNFAVSASNVSMFGVDIDTCEDLVIPATFYYEEGAKWYKVVDISEGAFLNCTNLTSVTISNSVTNIGARAFERCTNLTSVTIPDSVISIGVRAFDNCTSLTNVTIPDSVTNIGDHAFYKCTSLTSVTIPWKVTSLDDCVFAECTNLVTATILNGVSNLGSYCFAKCSNLTNVTIPDSVTSIGDRAFDSCTSLTNVTIPDSVTEIGEYAFNNCTSLTSVVIPDSVTSIERATFNGCRSLTGVTIGKSVTSISIHTFKDCINLTRITIPNCVTSINNYAFSGCTGLTSISFENTDGWYVTTTSGATSGEGMDVTNTSTNAINLTSSYKDYYWYRNVSE